MNLDEPDWDGPDWDDDDLMVLLETEHDMLVARCQQNHVRWLRVQECLWRTGS